MHITHIVVVVRVGSTDGELALLHRSIHTGISISVRHTGVRRNGIALDALAHGHDVEDATHALRVVLRTGVGYHLYLLYRRCRHTLQHLLRVLRHHVVGSSVDVHLKTRAAVHLDIAIAVYRHHRHLAQHLQYVVGLRIGVLLYVVRNFVDVGFHERLLRHDLHSAQHVRSLLYIQCVERYRGFAVRHNEVAHDGLLAHCVHVEAIAARLLQSHAEGAVSLRHGECGGGCRVGLRCDFHGGVLLAFLSSGISHYTLHHETLCGLGCCLGRCEQ